MRARDRIQRGFVEQGRRNISLALLAGLSCFTCGDGAIAQTAKPQHVIPPAEQAARDSERVEILRQELKKSEALLKALERRRSERLAAADAEGASEAEEHHGRTLSDIAGLQRELAAATRSASPTSGNAEAAVATKAAAPAAAPSRPAKAPPPAPWWDVYSKARRAEEPSAVSSPVSVAPAESGPRIVSARRPE